MADNTQRILLLAIAAGIWANFVTSAVFAHGPVHYGGAVNAVAPEPAAAENGRYLLAQTTQIGPVRFSLSLKVGKG